MKLILGYCAAPHSFCRHVKSNPPMTYLPMWFNQFRIGLTMASLPVLSLVLSITRGRDITASVKKVLRIPLSTNIPFTRSDPSPKFSQEYYWPTKAKQARLTSMIPPRNICRQQYRSPNAGEKKLRWVTCPIIRQGLPRMPDNFNPKDFSNPYADYTVEQMYAFLSGVSITA